MHPFDLHTVLLAKHAQHVALVHFPIALLTAAAVAELLQLGTGKPAYDAVSRYCIWFGTLSAMAAGVLGWFTSGRNDRECAQQFQQLPCHSWRSCKK